jgi:hypothetical protein
MRNKSAAFTYGYSTATVSQLLQDSSIIATSEVLKIPASRIQVRTDYSPEPENTTSFSAGKTSHTTAAGGLTIRKLAPLSTQEYLILPDAETDEQFSPLQLANLLLDQRIELARRISNFDETYRIISSEV